LASSSRSSSTSRASSLSSSLKACDLLRPQRLQHLLAHVLVEVGEGLGLDLLLGEGEELLALFRAQLLQQVGDVGGVQAFDQLAHDVALLGLERLARGLHRLRRDAVGDLFFLAIAGGVGQIVGTQIGHAVRPRRASPPAPRPPRARSC